MGDSRKKGGIWAIGYMRDQQGYMGGRWGIWAISRGIWMVEGVYAWWEMFWIVEELSWDTFLMIIQHKIPKIFAPAARKTNPGVSFSVHHDITQNWFDNLPLDPSESSLLVQTSLTISFVANHHKMQSSVPQRVDLFEWERQPRVMLPELLYVFEEILIMY